MKLSPAKRRIVFALCALAAGGLVAIAVWPSQKEPDYKGKKLSEWVNDGVIITQFGGRNRVWTMEQSAEALRHMGTNALPFLVKWLAYQRPAWRKAAFSSYCKLPLRFQNDSIRRRIYGVDPATRRDAVLWCFWILGSDARPAIPDLVELTKTPKAARDAILCLGFIGAPAMPALTKLADSPDERLRSQATLAIHGVMPRPWDGTKEGDWPEGHQQRLP